MCGQHTRIPGQNQEIGQATTGPLPSPKERRQHPGGRGLDITDMGGPLLAAADIVIVAA
ncbi:MAG: hypothetical protein ACJAZO_005361 [Myxococcota bacterium]|jgi:hypothetical protein